MYELWTYNIVFWARNKPNYLHLLCINLLRKMISNIRVIIFFGIESLVLDVEPARRDFFVLVVPSDLRLCARFLSLLPCLVDHFALDDGLQIHFIHYRLCLFRFKKSITLFFLHWGVRSSQDCRSLSLRLLNNFFFLYYPWVCLLEGRLASSIGMENIFNLPIIFITVHMHDTALFFTVSFKV